MSIARDRQTGRVYEGINFRGVEVEISFSEEADRGEGVYRVSTMGADVRRVPEEFAAFMEALTDLLDAMYVALRNPPDELRHG